MLHLTPMTPAEEVLWDRIMLRETQRAELAVDIVQEQINWWRQQDFRPEFAMLLLSGLPRPPGATRCTWVDVFEVALEAHRNVSKGRVVSYWGVEG